MPIRSHFRWPSGSKLFGHRKNKSDPFGKSSPSASASASASTSSIENNSSSLNPPRSAGSSGAESTSSGMVGTRKPILDDTALQGAITGIRMQSEKIYHHGYFLKLNDLDTNGRPDPDRSWTEVYAQLVGPVLVLWDSTATDSPDQDIPPTQYIRILDASFRELDSLKTGPESKKVDLPHVLSLSTAGKNRYLLHFGSAEVRQQWTAAFRLAIFEATALQESYTATLLVTHGSTLNSISSIMQPTSFRTENYAWVRFGAGTEWTRYYYVITPPPKKTKKGQSDRGSVAFFPETTTKVTNRTKPVAVISAAYAAYAIFPEQEALVSKSTLIKIEGSVVLRPNETDPVQNEGFVFVMPEPRPSVSGVEVMFQFLMRLYDAFGLYGRPNPIISDRGVADSLLLGQHQASHQYYECLPLRPVLDMTNRPESENWTDREWRSRMRSASVAHISQPSDVVFRSASASSNHLPMPTAGRTRSLSNPLSPAARRFSQPPQITETICESEPTPIRSSQPGADVHNAAHAGTLPVPRAPGTGQPMLTPKAPYDMVRRRSGLPEGAHEKIEILGEYSDENRAPSPAWRG